MSDGAQESSPPTLLALTAKIIVSHARANPIDSMALTSLIQNVYRALSLVGTPEEQEVAPEAPAVPIKRSVFRDYIICLEDGHKVKLLKRYIGAQFGLTPAQYRAKWALPSNYPMVSPAYSEERSRMARESGLGRKPAEETRRRSLSKKAASQKPAGKAGRRA